MWRQIDPARMSVNGTQSLIAELLALLRAERIFRWDGLTIQCGDMQLVMGNVEARVFQASELADTRLWMDFAPMTYEILGYLAPEYDYHAINAIAPGTDLCRVLHRDGASCRPLYAVNLVPVTYDGCLKQIDMSRPSPVAPTLELMGLDLGSQVSIQGRQGFAGDLDLGRLKVYEVSRLASMAELVFGAKVARDRATRAYLRPVTECAAMYQDDVVAFADVM